MAVVKEQEIATTSNSTTDTYSATFGSTPTSGNLLVMFGGARDSDSSGVPTIASLTTGWATAEVTSPMEYHIAFVAWKVSDGTESGAQGWTLDEDVHSKWIGLVEFSETGVSDWLVDVSAGDGSNTSNVASIATGTTGTLSADALVGVVAGTSRTSSENLSTSGVTGLTAFTDTDFEVDASAANFIGEYWVTSGTSAQNATVTQSGSSRMGAVIVVFKDAAGGGGGSVPVGSQIMMVT